MINFFIEILKNKYYKHIREDIKVFSLKVLPFKNILEPSYIILWYNYYYDLKQKRKKIMDWFMLV